MSKRIIITESQLKYIIENIDRINEQKVDFDALEKGRDFMNAKAKINQEQNKWGYSIFSLFEGSPKPINIDPPRVYANYYDNMVTINGTKNANQLVTDLDEIIDKLISTPGFKAENVVMEIQGAANANPPTMKSGKSGSNLDHPDSQPFGGIDVTKKENYQKGNLYLAKKRAESIKKYIEEKIPGITIKTSGKVIPGTKEEDKYISLSAKYKDTFKEQQISGKPKIVIENQLQIKTGKELGVSKETQTSGSVYGQDPNKKFYVGKRIIKFTPAGGKEFQMAFCWDGSMGDNPFSSKEGQLGTVKREGSWTGKRIGTTQTAICKQEDNLEAKMTTALESSGYFNKGEGSKLLEKIKTGDDESVINMGTVNNFDSLVKSLGIGGPFDMDLALKNGAYVIDNIKQEVRRSL